MFKNSLVFICFAFFVIAVESQRCRTAQDCDANECCSEYNYCGDSDEHCKNGRERNKPWCGNRQKGNGKCPKAGECCSQYFYCGTGPAYCGEDGNSGSNGALKSTGSFFDATILRSCNFTTSNQDLVASVPGTDKSSCGKFILVKTARKEVGARVTDIASSFPQNYIELSPAAYDVLAGKDKHVIPLNWDWTQ